MRRGLVIVLGIVLGCFTVGSNRVGGQVATPGPIILPVGEAPFGLGGLDLPDSPAGVTVIFARLPLEVQGQRQSAMAAHADDRLLASYGAPDPSFGPPLTLQALTFVESDFFPRDYTAGRFVEAVAQTSEYGAVAFGRDGELVWIQAETTARVVSDSAATPDVVRPIYTLAWGERDSAWLFTAAADTPQGLEALASAFAAAAVDPTGTPVTGIGAEGSATTGVSEVRIRAASFRSARQLVESAIRD